MIVQHRRASKQALQHSPELLVDVDAVGEAVETGLKDLMLFLFFGMPGTSSALLSNAAAALKLKLKLEREKIERKSISQSMCDNAMRVFVYIV